MTELEQDLILDEPVRTDEYGNRWRQIIRAGNAEYVDRAEECARCGEWVPLSTGDRSRPGRGVRYRGGYTPSGRFMCEECRQKALGSLERPVAHGFESNAPAEYMTASLAKFAPKIREQLSRWPEQHPFVGVVGVPGAGKTEICWAIERASSFAGRRIHVLDCERAKNQWAAADPLARERLLDLWGSWTFLALDDISRPAGTEGWVAAFALLLDQRYNSRKPTLVTAMDSGDAIEQKLGPMIRSRLNLYDWVVLPDVDHRSARR